jgi:hypothetical protein
MAELVAARSWLTACRLPPCASELNPVEAVWPDLKRSLANLTKQNIGQLDTDGEIKYYYARATSVQGFPSPWHGWTAVSLPAKPEPILTVFLLTEELEQACPWQPVGQRGGLLPRRVMTTAQGPGRSTSTISLRPAIGPSSSA